MDVFTAFAKGFVEGFIIQSLWNYMQKNQRTNNSSKRSTDLNNTDREVIEIDERTNNPGSSNNHIRRMRCR